MGDIDDDGNVSPGFHLPSASEDDGTPPPKKQKFREKHRADGSTSLGDEETLALALLRGR